MQALQKFKVALSSSELHVLQLCLKEAKQALPLDSIPWYLEGSDEIAGHLKPEHAKILQSFSSEWTSFSNGLRWGGVECTPLARTLSLELLTQQLRLNGHIPGWRNEQFSFWSKDERLNQELFIPDPKCQDTFRMERAAFRFFGLHSHAVHMNGFTSNGDMWCGRRSSTKSVDPGMLDNLAAGGLPAGESLIDCGVREMAEEAGLPPSLAQLASPSGHVETCRPVKEGWHHETLWVYNIELPDQFTPVNQDGEVSEFVRLSPSEVVEAIQQKAFTVDASCVIAHAVLQI